MYHLSSKNMVLKIMLIIRVHNNACCICENIHTHSFNRFENNLVIVSFKSFFLSLVNKASEF